jgi:hypothetical protein
MHSAKAAVPIGTLRSTGTVAIHVFFAVVVGITVIQLARLTAQIHKDDRKLLHNEQPSAI